MLKYISAPFSVRLFINLIFSKKSMDRKQLSAVIRWLNSVVNKQDLIFVDFSLYSGYFYFNCSSPRKKRLRILLKAPDEEKATFYIRKPVYTQKNNSKTKFMNQKFNAEDSQWICIFRSPELEIFENKKRQVLEP